jgi:hypothetical protein
MNNPDYIPQADMKFLEWATAMIHNLGKSLERFGFPEERYAQLVQLLDVFTRKLELATAPGTRTKPAVQGKNDARHALKKAIRQAVKEYLTYNHLVSGSDRDNLGLPVHKTSRTPAHAIMSRPELEVDFTRIQRHTLMVRDIGTRGAGKPAHAAGFEIWRKVGNPAPADDTDFQLVVQAPHSPCTLDYTAAESGQRAYYRVRWVNTRGVPGPWSNVKHAVIA